MEQTTKLEVSKPILSPTRSLDEGFESDPDRISTDSEHTTQTPTFDLLHRTDRDGVQHTAISRRNVESSPISSIICLDGESESDNAVNDEARHHSPPSSKLDHQTQANSDHKQTYRRVKNKAPLPPSNNKSSNSYQTIQPRSQSVDRIRSNPNDFHKSLTSNANNQNILAGRFVRVTVDPKQQQYMNYFKNYKSYQNQQNFQSNSRILPTGSTSNLYKSYHPSSSTAISSNKTSVSQSNNSHEPSGLLSLSNLSNKMPIQYGLGGGLSGGFATVKSPKSYHLQPYSSHQQQAQTSHLVCWTQSMDPRRARK